MRWVKYSVLRNKLGEHFFDTAIRINRFALNGFAKSNGLKPAGFCYDVFSCSYHLT